MRAFHLYRQEFVPALLLLEVLHRDRRLAHEGLERLVVAGVLTFALDRTLALHRWRNSTPDYVPPFSFEPERRRAEPKGNGRPEARPHAASPKPAGSTGTQAGLVAGLEGCRSGIPVLGIVLGIALWLIAAQNPDTWVETPVPPLAKTNP